MTRARVDGKSAFGSVSLLALGLCLVAGCSLPGGGRITLFPELAQLLPEARDLRQHIPPDVPRELQKQVLARYVIEPGDVLLIQPASLDSPFRLPGDQRVLSDGTIDLGRFGIVPAAGMTPEQLEHAISSHIQKQEKEAGPILVRLLTAASQVYYVLGEVNAPGAYPLLGRETALDGILVAGGLNDRASRTEIILSRPTHPDQPRVVLPVCYNQIVQLGDTTTNYQLAPGDRIFVPARSFAEDKFGCHDASGPCAVPRKLPWWRTWGHSHHCGPCPGK
jgi:protein involved in polysaccharide export with SLBB domain